MRMAMFCGLLVLLAGSTAADAASLSARQIVDRSLERNFFGFENAEARVAMALTGKSGTVRTRDLIIRSRQTPAKLGQTLVRFLTPADVAGTAFLVHERADTDDDQFLYLPAFGKVKRINSRQKKKRFLGTDFTYGDMQSGALKRGELTRKPDESISGQPVYVIDAVPQADEGSQYSRVVTYIHQQTFIPMRMLFYAPDGSVHKEMLVYKIKRQDGRWVVMDSLMRDDKRGTSTRLTIATLNATVKLSADDFTKAAMTR